MNGFKAKIDPLSHGELNHTLGSLKIIKSSILNPTNQDLIHDFFSKQNLHIEFAASSREIEEKVSVSSEISHAIKTSEPAVILEQMNDTYMKEIISKYNESKEKDYGDYENEYNHDENKENEAILSKGNNGKKSKKKKKAFFENSIAMVNHDSMMDVLKGYKHYQDNMDDTLQVPLNGATQDADEYFLSTSPDFLNNIQTKINTYLEIRKQENPEEGESSCDSSDKESGFHPLIHQDVVKQYLNATSPYRGLLLFHGLGSGKTCTSIGIIEAMKQKKQKIYIMTPASLRKNYQTQMMFCGSELFRKTEKWEYVPYPNKTEDPENYSLFKTQVKKLTGLPEKYLKKQKGIYLIRNSSFNGNYDRSEVDEKQLEEQIKLMIANRFKFLSYNGITKQKWLNTYKGGDKKKNPFHHSTVIIDEGHNFVSRILNKLNTNDSSVSTEMYKDLICAENCNVVLLSGTPLINYPSELGVLFNIVGGSRVIIEIPCDHKNSKKKSKSEIKKALESLELIHHIDFKYPCKQFKNKKYGLLKILKNPYGFMKKTKNGAEIIYDKQKASITNDELKMKVINELKKNDYVIDEGYEKSITSYNLFPDNETDFGKKFMPNGTFTNKEYFLNKIVGMVSYIGDKRELMPEIQVPDDEYLAPKLYKNEDIFVEEIPMTKTTLRGYAEARSIEKDMERSMQKSSKDKQTSSYQIFSRAACNFVFPPNIKRPYLKRTDKMNEDDLEVYDDLEKVELPDGRYEIPDNETNLKTTKEKNQKYKEEIKQVLTQLEHSPHLYFESSIRKFIEKEVLEYVPKAKSYNIDMAHTPTNQLTEYSPKFHRVLENITNDDNNGLHMVYSNFRTLEGIGIFKIILDYYGYTEFRIKKVTTGSSISYKLAIDHPYYTKPSFFKKDEVSTGLRGRKFYALYTGKENEEDKEMIRNIFNGQLDKLPTSLRNDIATQFYGGNYMKLTPQSNLYGDLIQLLIISSSGAEGIDLKNVRFVHIMEPYWHPVRIEQVIGRARRICSHKDLPAEEQTVKVYMYLLIHNQTLLSSDYGSQFAGLKEVQDYDQKERRTISTDERLYNIMKRKKDVMEEFLTCLKRSSIDCRIHYEDKGQCLNFYRPPGIDYRKDKKTATKRTTKSSQKWKGIGVNNNNNNNNNNT
tara:strand:+ start:1587 stop:5024 length:3438 start_codon:yes stop_codon:yes gene_type:complete